MHEVIPTSAAYLLALIFGGLGVYMLSETAWPQPLDRGAAAVDLRGPGYLG